jgi:hypothetical protein
MNPPTETEGRPKCSEKGCGRWMAIHYKTNSTKSFRKWQRKKGVWMSKGLCAMHMKKKYKMWPYDIKGNLSRIIGRPSNLRRGRKDETRGRVMACLAVLAFLLLGSMTAYALSLKVIDGTNVEVWPYNSGTYNIYGEYNTTVNVIEQNQKANPSLENNEELSALQIGLNWWNLHK